MSRALPLLVLVAALAACGGGREHGTATLWVTRDRGAHVVYTGTVPAGLTAMQALDRKLDVKTRYGGRFVESISGVDGSLRKQRDWFYFVNGVEGDRSAAEVRLRPGDVEWWDYRSWKGGAMSVPVIVGAFPEPLVHGFQWAKPGARVVGAGAAARKLARLFPRGPNVVEVRPGSAFAARREGDRVRFVIGEHAAELLARDPTLARYHYEGIG